jgi:hypothetical protein
MSFFGKLAGAATGAASPALPPAPAPIGVFRDYTVHRQEVRRPRSTRARTHSAQTIFKLTESRLCAPRSTRGARSTLSQVADRRRLYHPRQL